MGAFLCSISERDWEITRIKGIYGNKAGTIREGSYKLFSPSTQYSIIRDLAGMKKGDLIFFHVIRKNSPSTIHGVYIVREEPFYNEDKVWKDSKERFPYRFLFEPHPKFEHLTKYDAYVEVIDLYELIEQRKIWTLATLENEVNIEARSVRKIEESREAKEIIRILYRDFNHNKLSHRVLFKPIIQKGVPIRKKIKDIGRYENAVKALLMYLLGEKDRSIIKIFGDVIDFMNEVFIAQTTRKSIDILCISGGNENNKIYTIVEVKTGKCDERSLSQVLYYMDLFKRRGIMNLEKDIIVGCLLGKDFSTRVIKYSRQRNLHRVNGRLILVQYIPNNDGNDAKFHPVII